MLQIRRTLFSVLLCVGVVAVGFIGVFAGKAFKNGRNGPHVEYPETSAPAVTEVPETTSPYTPVNASERETQADETGTADETEPPETEAPKTEAPTKKPEKQPDEDKVIYLTFDDGPGRYTERLLDILKKHNVKATFFVTAQYGYEELIAREAREGHAVGVHTYSHKYEKIYAGTDAFWDDFQKMQDVIVEQTGVETRLMRFPGGSSNTLSNFTPGIMTELTQEAGERGLAYFDWNVSSGDAGGTSSSAGVLENCKNGVSQCRTSVVLCHDIKDFTVNAMDDFITWALDRGYTFKALTADSWPAHHKVFN